MSSHPGGPVVKEVSRAKGAMGREHAHGTLCTSMTVDKQKPLEKDVAGRASVALEPAGADSGCGSLAPAAFLALAKPLCTRSRRRFHPADSSRRHTSPPPHPRSHGVTTLGVESFPASVHVTLAGENWSSSDFSLLTGGGCGQPRLPESSVIPALKRRRQEH